MRPELELPGECSRIVIDEETLTAAVADLARQIDERHGTDRVRLVTVLRGGLFFLADLCRQMKADVTLDFLAVSPYVPGQGGVVRVTKDLDDDLQDQVVILVEDVVDTGLTVNYVLSLLRSRQPRVLEVCALLDKRARRIADVPIDYTGFTMSDVFLVGYGLDLSGRYRNLPYVAELRPEVVLK